MTTRHPADPRRQSPAPTLSRAERKAQLLATIEQQRIDILVDANRWREASQPLDAGWQHLMRFKPLMIAAGGVLLLHSARHPNRLVRLARRLAGGALVVSRARRLLGPLLR